MRHARPSRATGSPDRTLWPSSGRHPGSAIDILDVDGAVIATGCATAARTGATYAFGSVPSGVIVSTA